MRTGIQSQPGVILKKNPYGEADEILTVLFRHDGIRKLFAAGSRRSKKRYPGILDRFAHVNCFYMANGRGLWRLTDADILDPSTKHLWRHIPCYAFVNYLAELMCALSPEASGDASLYHLWLGLCDEIKAVQGRAQKEDLAALFVRCLFAVFQISGFAAVLDRHAQSQHDIKSLHALLKQLVAYSHHILQRKTRSADFFLETITAVSA